MFVFDYNTVIYQQFQGVDKSQKRLNSYYSEYLNFVREHVLPLNNILKKVNSSFINKLFLSKGVLSDIIEKQDSLKGKDLNEVINLVNDLIKKNIALNNTVEDILSLDLSRNVPQLTITSALLSETIEILYTSLRYLKRANIKKGIPTSDLARTTAMRSSRALGKVLSE